MKIVIPQDLKGKELFAFLVANKSAIIAEKKSLPKYCDALSICPEYFGVKDNTAVKTTIGDIAPDATSVRVKLVANAANWMDSQYDVLIEDCWAKSIKEGKGRKHLKDHRYSIDAEIGDVQSIYSQQISLSELGLNKAGSTQCLIYESDVKREYDQNAFNKYKAGRITQHSIGLQYVRIDLAIYDEDYEKELDFWNKYIGLIINREAAEERGFFWVVSEIKLLEVSAVLFGSNELTPTLDVKSDTQHSPLSGTSAAPSSEGSKSFSEYLSETKLLTI